jgi:hypothetical protein
MLVSVKLFIHVNSPSMVSDALSIDAMSPDTPTYGAIATPQR